MSAPPTVANLVSRTVVPVAVSDACNPLSGNMSPKFLFSPTRISIVSIPSISLTAEPSIISLGSLATEVPPLSLKTEIL